MTGIVVITDNGELPPPRGTGKRRGYQSISANGVLFAEIGLPARILPPEKKEEVPTASVGGVSGLSLAVYNNLRRTAYLDGKCWNCSHFPNPTSIICLNGGLLEREIVICGRCDTKMKPR